MLGNKSKKNKKNVKGKEFKSFWGMIMKLKGKRKYAENAVIRKGEHPEEW